MPHPLLDVSPEAATTEEGKQSLFYETQIREGILELLKDHVVLGWPITPGAVFFDALMAAALSVAGTSLELGDVEMREAAILRPMLLRELPELWGCLDGSALRPTRRSHIRVQVEASRQGESVSVSISSSYGGGLGGEASLSGPAVHARAKLSLQPSHSARPQPICTESLTTGLSERHSQEAVYAFLRGIGLAYGPRFQTISALHVSSTRGVAELRLLHAPLDIEQGFLLHPSILDGCFQALLCILSRGLSAHTPTYVPVAASGLRVMSRLGEKRGPFWGVVEVQTPRQADDAFAVEVVASIKLLDEQGQALAEIDALRVKQVARQNLFPRHFDLDRGLLWEMAWRECEQAVTEKAVFKRVLVFGVPAEEKENARCCLESVLGSQVYVECRTDVASRAEAAAALSLSPFDAVLHVRGLTDEELDAKLYAVELLSMLQGVVDFAERDAQNRLPLMVVCASGSARVVAEDAVENPERASAWGLCRSARIEMEGLLAKPVPLAVADLPKGKGSRGFCEALRDAVDCCGWLAKRLRTEGSLNSAGPLPSREFKETEVALRRGRVYRSELTTSRVALGSPLSSKGVECSGCHVVTGGLGALGLVVASWLCQRRAETVVLLSRTGKLPSEGERALLWRRLRSLAASTQIIVVQCDVSDRQQVSHLLRSVARKSLVSSDSGKLHRVGPLRGVFHCAGELSDTQLLQQTAKGIEKTFQAKVGGAWNLDAALKEHALEAGLQWFLLFSSSVGLLGNPGQCNYAAANTCIDALAERRRVEGFVASSIQWGPWTEQGMAAGLQGRLKKGGLGGLSNALALMAMEQVLLQEAATSVACQPIYWSSFLQRYPHTLPAAFQNFEAAASRLIRALGADQQKPSLPDNSAYGPSALPDPKGQSAPALSTPEARRKQIQQLVTDAAKGVLTEVEQVPTDAPLHELGIDSLGSIEFRNTLQNALKLKLAATVLFDHPTISALTDYLLQQTSSLQEQPGKTRQQVALTVKRPAEPPRDVISPQDSSWPHIAVIGMACRFPGNSNSVEKFWSTLACATDCTSEIPTSRFDLEASYSSDKSASGKMYVRRAAFIQGLDLFDNAFFHISEGEALHMDPRQRLALEITLEAALGAFHSIADLDGRPVNVFVGAMNQENTFHEASGITAYTATSCSLTGLSNRISYAYGLTGESITIDSACSSSLVALALARQTLRNEGQEAFVVGVNALINPMVFIQTCKANMLSPDGRCKTFDASANGYVRSEGCGALYLKAVPRHATPPETVYAWIRGTATNHVGRSASLTAPNGPAQQAVIRAALQDAGLYSPAAVCFLESHGTGTSLGDPIEVGAFRAVYCRDCPDSPPLVVGALKSVMGHAEGAAGVAGLIKLILTLQRRTATPNLHLKTLNPHIDLRGEGHHRGLLFPTKSVPLGPLLGLQSDEALIGAVSSFGFGGSNAHAIVEVSTTFKAAAPSEPRGGETPETSSVVDVQQRPSVWVFTGQGSQYAGMAQAFFKHSKTFRDTLASCTAHLKQEGLLSADGEPDAASLEELIYGGRLPASRASELLDQTRYSQLAIYALELALSRVMLEQGLKPTVVVGHSLGEFAAATVAGVIDWKDGLCLVARRATLMDSVAKREGVMAVCRASSEEVKVALKSEPHRFQSVSLAADNGPNSVTVSGSKDQVQALLSQMGLASKAKFLAVSHAFHSPLMAEAVPAMHKLVSEFSLKPATLQFASTVRGRLLEPTELQSPKYWSEQLVLPVRFREAVQAAVQAVQQEANGSDITLVEIGPQRTLLNLASQVALAAGIDKLHAFSVVDREDGTEEAALEDKLATCREVCGVLRGSRQTPRHKWNHK